MEFPVQTSSAQTTRNLPHPREEKGELQLLLLRADSSRKAPPNTPLWAAPNNKKCLNLPYDLFFPPFFLPRPEKIPHFENKIVQKTKMTQSWSSVSCTASSLKRFDSLYWEEGVMLQRFFREEKEKEKRMAFIFRSFSSQIVVRPSVLC